jgi:superfamily II DNA or RNA helicase
MSDKGEHIAEIERRLSALEDEKRRLEVELCALRLEDQQKKQDSFTKNAPVSLDPITPDRIKLFVSLFRGRSDVFPKRWDNAKTGRSGYSPACKNEWARGASDKPRVPCSACTHQAWLPVAEGVIRKHLCGDTSGWQPRDYTIGVYPLLKDETCWFLAVDFDKENWQRDVAAFVATCGKKNVPVTVERSRSGNGAHAWVFFAQAIAASVARKLGSALLTETMEQCPDIGFESYDRLFPNQDTMPAGGFGNLIALPFQKTPRTKGNSVFIDEHLVPYPDQWGFLQSIRRMAVDEVLALVDDASLRGRILGVRMPVDEDEGEPWLLPPSRKKPIVISGTLPTAINITIGNQLYIPKQDLPPPLINRLIRLAAFQNPEFYAAQAMRLSTFDKPRIIACAKNFSQHIGLPRGCLDTALDMFKSLGIRVEADDQRLSGNKLDTSFVGELLPEQKKAVIALLPHDTGVLAATTAFGKTVVAAHMIAQRKINTLVLVHRQQLAEQWQARLQTFLDIDPKMIGQIGGGKRKPTGIIDIALIQSLCRKNEVDDLVANYGHLIVDECHHLSAVSFEAVARAFKGKYVLGLTATATRKDGHHPIIFMQCGPIRYRVDPREQALQRPFTHQVIVRDTQLLPPAQSEGETKLAIHQLYAHIVSNASRNNMIYRDVQEALIGNRTPLILTERKEHAIQLAELLKEICPHVIIMHGGLSDKARKQTMQRLAEIPETEPRIIVATGRYIGEGFDDPRLDTLFLAMPISWHGTLAQYAGRLHRLYHAKKEVIIYDYVDRQIPMLARMAEKRMKGYARLGYAIKQSPVETPHE